MTSWKGFDLERCRRQEGHVLHSHSLAGERRHTQENTTRKPPVNFLAEGAISRPRDTPGPLPLLPGREVSALSKTAHVRGGELAALSPGRFPALSGQLGQTADSRSSPQTSHFPPGTCGIESGHPGAPRCPHLGLHKLCQRGPSRQSHWQLVEWRWRSGDSEGLETCRLKTDIQWKI